MKINLIFVCKGNVKQGHYNSLLLSLFFEFFKNIFEDFPNKKTFVINVMSKEFFDEIFLACKKILKGKLIEFNNVPEVNYLGCIFIGQPAHVKNCIWGLRSNYGCNILLHSNIKHLEYIKKIGMKQFFIEEPMIFSKMQIECVEYILKNFEIFYMSYALCAYGNRKFTYKICKENNINLSSGIMPPLNECDSDDEDDEYDYVFGCRW